MRHALISALTTALGRLRRTPLAAWPLLQFGVADGAALYMLAFLTSAVLGIARQVLFNAQFGLGEDAAAYYAAFRLPETIGALISGGTLTNAMVPILLRAGARSGPAAELRLLNRTLTLLLAAFAPLALACAVAAPLFVSAVLAPGLAPATQALTVSLSRLMLLEVLLVVAEAALVALLVSRGQLLLPAIAIALRNLTLIGGIGLAIWVPGVGIYGPTLGAILDALIQLAILAPGLRGRGYRPRLEWAPGDRDLRAILGLLGPSALSAVVNYAGGIADTAFASLAGRAAALGAIQNAFLLIGLPIRLLGIAIGQAALPRIAALALADDREGQRRALGRALLVAGGLSALAALALAALGRPLIALLYERGQFDAAAGDLTYTMLVAYAVGLPGYVATELASRALIARLDARTPMITNMLQLAARVGLILALIGPLGALAIPLAFAASSAGEAALLWAVVWRGLRRPGAR